MRYRKYGDGVIANLVMDCVGEAVEQRTPDGVFVFRPNQRIACQPVNGLNNFVAKGFGCQGTPFGVPAEGLPDFRFCLRQDADDEPAHRLLSRTRASVQHNAWLVPARSAACRARTSWRQASVIESS